MQLPSKRAESAAGTWPNEYSSARVALSNILLCLHGTTGAGDHVAASALRFMDIVFSRNADVGAVCDSCTPAFTAARISLDGYEQALNAARDGLRRRQQGVDAAWPAAQPPAATRQSLANIDERMLNMAHAAYCLAYKTSAPANSETCLSATVVFVLCGKVMAVLSRRPAAKLLRWQHSAEKELLSLSTPAAKFESGLRCALGGAFGVDVSLAAAAQRDAGATIVNVTSTVQHIPHVGGLKQPELAGTLSLLQETLMEVYTSYRGVVAKHASVAAMVQAPALLQFLQQSSVQHDEFPYEDPKLPDMDVTEYLQSQAENGRAQQESALFMAVQAACALELKTAELKVLDALDSHLLRPSIVSVTYMLSQQTDLKETLGCPSDSTSVAFRLVGAAWHLLCRARSPQQAADQQQLVLDAAVSVLQPQQLDGADKATAPRKPQFARICVQRAGSTLDAMDASTLQALPFVAHSLPMLLHASRRAHGPSVDRTESQGTALSPDSTNPPLHEPFMVVVPHKLLRLPRNALAPGKLPASASCPRQESANSLDQRDPLLTSLQQPSFEGVEVCSMQDSSLGMSDSLSVPRSYTASSHALLAGGSAVRNGSSYTQLPGGDALNCTTAEGDPSGGNAFMSPKRPRRGSVCDPREAPIGLMSPSPSRHHVDNRTPGDSPTRRPLAPLRRQQRCVESPVRTGTGRPVAASGAASDEVCRRICFEDVQEEETEYAAHAHTSVIADRTAGQELVNSELRSRRALPPIRVKSSSSNFAAGCDESGALPLAELPPGGMVTLQQPLQGASVPAAVRLPEIAASRGVDSVGAAQVRLGPLRSGAAGPVMDDCLTDEDEDCDLLQLHSTEQLPPKGFPWSSVPGTFRTASMPYSAARSAAVQLSGSSPSFAGASPGLSDGASSPGMEGHLRLPWEGNPVAASPLSRFDGRSGGSVKRLRSGEVALPPVVPRRAVWCAQRAAGSPGNLDEAQAGGTPCVVLTTETSVLHRVARALGFVPVDTCALPAARAVHVMSSADVEALLPAPPVVLERTHSAAGWPLELPRRMSALPEMGVVAKQERLLPATLSSRAERAWAGVA